MYTRQFVDETELFLLHHTGKNVYGKLIKNDNNTNFGRVQILKKKKKKR